MTLRSNILHILAVLFIGAVHGCSIANEDRPLPWYTMEQTLDEAPAVIYGTHVSHEDYEGGERNDTIDVHCVFKTGGLSIPSTIYLDDVGWITCDATRLVVGKKYLIAIKAIDMAAAGDFGGKESPNFAVDYPDAAHTAAFEATVANLKAVADLCGMDAAITSPSGDEDMCPTRTVTAETCNEPSLASMATVYSVAAYAVLGLFCVVF